MEMNFDVRTHDHHRRRRGITVDEKAAYDAALEASLAALPDDADNAEECTTRFAAPFAERLQKRTTDS